LRKYFVIFEKLLLIYDFATAPVEVPYILGKCNFLFYQCIYIKVGLKESGKFALFDDCGIYSTFDYRKLKFKKMVKLTFLSAALQCCGSGMHVYPGS
jgi:hypothetical protein